MGNETSSVRIHTLLTAEDIKGLRAAFPGSGNGPPPNDLKWGNWPHWHADELGVLEKMLKDEQGNVTFNAYQEIAGNFVHFLSNCSFSHDRNKIGNAVRGTCEDRVKLLFKLLDSAVDKTIKSSELIKFVQHMCETAGKILNPNVDPAKNKDKSTCFALSLVHELVFPGETLKASVQKQYKIKY